jgi:FixJ family two-component response regulator
MSEGLLYRLLVADDEPWVVENLRQLIDWQGFSIDFLPPAFDGEAALDRLASERPDILITDINMPFIDGNALIRAAKDRYPGLQFIVLSGYSDFPFVRDALLHGAVDYLLKPIMKNSLIEVLEKTLRILGSRKERAQEESELRDRLRSASSILQDIEMSDAILGSPIGSQGKRSPPALDLDLEFASFTLVLVRLVGGRGGIATLEDRKSEEIKTIIAGLSRGAKQIVFHNLYARSEYVLIADLDSKGLSLVLEELPDRIRRRTWMSAGVGASGCHYSFDHVRSAYQEARAAFMIRPIGKKTPPVGLASGGYEVNRRVTPELERRLIFALESRNRQMSLDIMFDEIGLRRCEELGWLLIEAKQTAEYMAGMIYHRADPGPAASAGSMLAMDNLSELLSASLEREDIPETCSILEQLLPGNEPKHDWRGPTGREIHRRALLRGYISYLDRGGLPHQTCLSVPGVQGSDRLQHNVSHSKDAHREGL